MSRVKTIETKANFGYHKRLMNQHSLSNTTDHTFRMKLIQCWADKSLFLKIVYATNNSDNRLCDDNVAALLPI